MSFRCVALLCDRRRCGLRDSDENGVKFRSVRRSLFSLAAHSAGALPSPRSTARAAAKPAPRQLPRGCGHTPRAHESRLCCSFISRDAFRARRVGARFAREGGAVGPATNRRRPNARFGCARRRVSCKRALGRTTCDARSCIRACRGAAKEEAQPSSCKRLSTCWSIDSDDLRRARFAAGRR